MFVVLSLCFSNVLSLSFDVHISQKKLTMVCIILRYSVVLSSVKTLYLLFTGFILEYLSILLASLLFGIC